MSPELRQVSRLTVNDRDPQCQSDPEISSYKFPISLTRLERAITCFLTFKADAANQCFQIWLLYNHEQNNDQKYL